MIGNDRGTRRASAVGGLDSSLKDACSSEPDVMDSLPVLLNKRQDCNAAYNVNMKTSITVGAVGVDGKSDESVGVGINEAVTEKTGNYLKKSLENLQSRRDFALQLSSTMVEMSTS